jgi:hypothetical protein
MREKLQDAIFKMKPGDKFKPENDYEMIMNQTMQLVWPGGGNVSMSPAHLNLEGEIIPAEPKVLTAEEFIGKGYNHPVEEQRYHYEDMVMIANRFHKNGRLERDLELRPLVKAVKEYHVGMSRNSITDVIDAIENLPPLNKNDQ